MFNPLEPEVHVNDTQNSVYTLQQEHSSFITETKQLMLFKKIITVYCEKYMKHINTLGRQNKRISNVKAGGTDCYQCAVTG